MKTRILFAVTILAGCGQATQTVDLAQAESDVNTLFENYGNSTKAKDVEGVAAALDNDGLFLGTDPGEYWSKDSLVSMFRMMTADPAFSFDFTLQKRDIRVSPDGNSAVVIEQAMVPFLSKRVPIRSIGHAKQKDGKWLIDFYSWQLAPLNNDLYKLDSALAKLD